MNAIVNLYSSVSGEINRFLNAFWGEDNFSQPNDLKWEKSYDNPIEISDIIGTFIDNSDKYNINMWVSFDENIFVNITSSNSDKIIKYLFERFPY
jgi:hypothetical protein